MKITGRDSKEKKTKGLVIVVTVSFLGLASLLSLFLSTVDNYFFFNCQRKDNGHLAQRNPWLEAAHTFQLTRHYATRRLYPPLVALTGSEGIEEGKHIPPTSI